MRIQGLAVGFVLLTASLTMPGPALSSAAANTQPHHAPKAPMISERTARDIAWSFGVVRVEEIMLAGALWEIAGHDQDGNERILDISAYDGRTLNRGAP